MRLRVRAVSQMAALEAELGRRARSSDAYRGCHYRHSLTYLRSRASAHFKRRGGAHSSRRTTAKLVWRCASGLLPSSCRARRSLPRRTEKKKGSSSEAQCRKDCGRTAHMAPHAWRSKSLRGAAHGPGPRKLDNDTVSFSYRDSIPKKYCIVKHRHVRSRRCIQIFPTRTTDLVDLPPLCGVSTRP